MSLAFPLGLHHTLSREPRDYLPIPQPQCSFPTAFTRFGAMSAFALLTLRIDSISSGGMTNGYV
jgi:hypothetical protein